MAISDAEFTSLGTIGVALVGTFTAWLLRSRNDSPLEQAMKRIRQLEHQAYLDDAEHARKCERLERRATQLQILYMTDPRPPAERVIPPWPPEQQRRHLPARSADRDH